LEILALLPYKRIDRLIVLFVTIVCADKGLFVATIYTIDTDEPIQIDDTDYRFANQYCWLVRETHNNHCYLATLIKNFVPVYLHKLIAKRMGLKDQRIYFADKNPFNCQRSNLITCNTRINNKTGVKGVTYVQKRDHYAVTRWVNGERKYLGVFKTLEETKRIK
jgi:hypothetical protein